MKKRIISIFPVLLTLILACSFMAACGEEQEPVVTMSLNITSRTLQVGPGAAVNQKTVTLKATVKEDDVAKTDAVVEWLSSDETKATVDAGVVTAVAAGTVTITAQYGELTDTCAITVEQRELITVGQTSATIDITTEGADPTFQIVASVTGGGTITWVSSNEAVATVSATGLVMAVASGEATITASSAGAASVPCSIIVVNLNEPYPLTTGNYAAVVGDPGQWYWFTQGANISGGLVVMSGANFDPVSQTIKIDFDKIVNGWDDRFEGGAKEYAFRLQPWLTENKADNNAIEYKFTATFTSNKSGKLCVYDYNFGENVPSDEELVAKREELGVSTDLSKWYLDVEAGEEVTIEFTGTLRSGASLTIRPYMFSDYDEETETTKADDPVSVMLSGMKFFIAGEEDAEGEYTKEMNYRTGLPMATDAA